MPASCPMRFWRRWGCAGGVQVRPRRRQRAQGTERQQRTLAALQVAQVMPGGSASSAQPPLAAAVADALLLLTPWLLLLPLLLLLTPRMLLPPLLLLVPRMLLLLLLLLLLPLPLPPTTPGRPRVWPSDAASTAALLRCSCFWAAVCGGVAGPDKAGDTSG